MASRWSMKMYSKWTSTTCWHWKQRSRGPARPVKIFRIPWLRRGIQRTSLSRGNPRTYRLRILPRRIGNDGDRRTLILGEGCLRLPHGRGADHQGIRDLSRRILTDGAVMSKRLYAGNLNFEMTDSLLRQ